MYSGNVKIVDLMESLWAEAILPSTIGCSSIQMFTPKHPEHMKEKDEIIKQMRNLYGEKNEKSEKKKLNKRLYDLFKQEDLISSNKKTLRVPINLSIV